MITSRTKAIVAAGALLAAAAFCGSCTDAALESSGAANNAVSAYLTLRGRVCTSPPDVTGFPVKVVLLVDQSGSMCISDPPGAQQSPGFCEQLATLGIIPPGLTEPARVRALKRLVQQFSASPNVQVALVPFETNVQLANLWPTGTANGSRFARPDATLDDNISRLQATLGTGTDYQGAMAEAYAIISGDILQTAQSNPELLPRTRYVVVFLTDGTPYPRCSGNDNLAQYADPWNPQLTWADSASAVDFCNLTDPRSPDVINGFTPGTDRNQNYQIFSYVERMMELKDAYNIGDIRMHSVLLFNQEAVRNCGTICQDVYGVYPSVAQADYPTAAHQIARWTLQQMAEMGNGVYQEFLDGDIQSLGLGALDYSSLASPFKMKRLMVQALRSAPYHGARVVDSDGDGIPDDLDNDYTHQTNPYFADSDGDCLDDGFEIKRADQGFVPSSRSDPRACDPSSPISWQCSCSDTDGDGLSQFAESFLSTHRDLVDSDGDGVPDGLEARYQLDPNAPTVGILDTDGDGISDLDEFLADTDPTYPDRDLHDSDGYRYEIRAVPQSDGSTCYDYAVTNIRMLSPPSHAGSRQGINLYKVWFAEAPASGVSSDYGVWRTACARARYAPPGIREPVGPAIVLDDARFVPPQSLSTEDELRSACVGAGP